MSYHTTLRQKSATSSVLDEIPGVGPATRKKLIKHFGSVRNVTSASEAELASVVGTALATKIHAHLAP